MANLLSEAYGLAIGLRNRLFDRGLKSSERLGARTLSVGNITTGGTGKTPIVALVSEMLADEGKKVYVLTRGYGRRDENKQVVVYNVADGFADVKEAGDEPLELARRLLGKATVIANADRVAAAASVTKFIPPEGSFECFGPIVFVLDDAFQHRRVFRDLDIVCIDATDPFGGGKLLPAGSLREPLSGLSRADVFIITRSDLIDLSQNSEAVIGIENTIRQYNPDAPIFYGNAVIRETSRLGNHKYDAELRSCDRSMPIFAACAIGNPEAFFKTLRKDGYDLVGTLAFRDHHTFTAEDIRTIEKDAARAGADAVVMTQKDAVKLQEQEFTMPFYAAMLQTGVEPMEEFRRLVLGL